MNRFKKAELQEELQLIEEYLAEYLWVPEYGGEIGKIFKDVGQSKGQRIRPMLLLLAGRYGENYRNVRDRLCRLGALVELVHMASLIHDDIVDDAPLRRGKPTTQSKYSKDKVVFSGDFILSRIVQSLFVDGFFRVGVFFGETVEAMCIGELGQMEWRFQENVTVEQYIRNIYGKSASLCKLACTVGGYESGCCTNTMKKLEELGQNFGYMFQIRDDLLDFFSNTKEDEKKTLVDFRDGVLTLPVLYAMKDPEAHKQIVLLLNNAKAGHFGSSEAKLLNEIVTSSKGLSDAITDMEMYAERALNAIGKLPNHEVNDVFREFLETNCKI